MQALSALTPPLVVCAVVIIAIVAFLRHEMGRPRNGAAAPGEKGEVPAVPAAADLDKEPSELTDVSPAAGEDRARHRDA